MSIAVRAALSSDKSELVLVTCVTMSQLELLNFAALTAHALLLAFSAAVAGVLTNLFAWTVLQALISSVSQVKYALRRWRTLVFSFGSKLRNWLYSVRHKKFTSAVIPFPNSQIVKNTNHSNIKLVVIIPGTWAAPNYRWERWNCYKVSLELAGIEVYCLQWRSQNSEDCRLDAAKVLAEWLRAKDLPDRSVGLIGHSYGGQVAAMVSSEKSVARVVTIAAPFITSFKLSNAQIAAGAQAHFGRLFLRSLAALTAIALICYFSRFGSAIIAEGPAKIFYYCFFTTAVLYALFMITTVVRFKRLIRSQKDFPETVQDAAKIATIRIARDEILDEMISASGQAEATPVPNENFLHQNSLTRSNLLKWARPFFLFCWVAEIIRLANWPGDRPDHTPGVEWSMVFGVGYLIIYFSAAWLFSTISLNVRGIRNLLVDLFSLVSYKSVLRHNRRAFVGWIAGVETHKIDLYAINIEGHIKGCNLPTIIAVNLVKPKQLFASGVHSICIEKPSVVTAALHALCGEGQTPSSWVHK